MKIVRAIIKLNAVSRAPSVTSSDAPVVVAVVVVVVVVDVVGLV